MARKLILNLAMSLDGFIADKDGGYGWIRSYGQKTLDAAGSWSHEEFLRNIDIVVMGWKCFEQQLHRELDEKEIYVATSRKQENFGNIRFIDGDIVGAVLARKPESGRDIYLYGGGILAEPFLRGHLIDEYIIGLIPVILGGGIPLFVGEQPAAALELTRCYTDNGIVILRYVPVRRGAGTGADSAPVPA